MSEKDLKSAYRRLAKANHPDQNKDDPKAHAKFAEISAAYDFLTDREKKGAYDRGEIDADGNPKFAGFSGNGARLALTPTRIRTGKDLIATVRSRRVARGL